MSAATSQCLYQMSRGFRGHARRSPADLPEPRDHRACAGDPRIGGACWLTLLLWRELQLDQFWCQRLGVSRKGTPSDPVSFLLVAYPLLSPATASPPPP